eukprot:265467_1
MAQPQTPNSGKHFLPFSIGYERISLTKEESQATNPSQTRCATRSKIIWCLLMTGLLVGLLILVAELFGSISGGSPNSNFPRFIGHRGVPGIAPENTIPSFERSNGDVEFDLQITSDNRIIIFHDDTVNRTTNGSGFVSNMTLAQIKTLDAGSWFSEEFVGVKVPTFEEFLEWFTNYPNWEDHTLSFDIKGDQSQTVKIIDYVFDLNLSKSLLSRFMMGSWFLETVKYTHSTFGHIVQPCLITKEIPEDFESIPEMKVLSLKKASSFKNGRDLAERLHKA